MQKYIYIVALLIFSFESFATRTFDGAYTGIGLAYSYTNVRIDNQTYGAKTAYFNFFGGQGFIRNDIYYGLEGSLHSDQFSKKVDGKRLTKFFGLSASARIGRIIEENFLPYFKLGLRRDVYSLKKANPDDRFASMMIVPSVGVDAFVEDWFLIRSEVEYGMGFDNNGAEKSISRKPRTLLVRAGALLKF